MITDEALVDYVRLVQEQIGLASTDTASAVAELWSSVGGLTDAQQLAFAEKASKMVASAQRVVADMTTGYLKNYVQLVGEPVTNPIPPLDLSTLREGVDPVTVYSRPATVARVKISEGKSFDQAMVFARDRALQLADTDVMNAHRYSAQNTLRNIPQVVGYRRVPDGGACLFCQLAATQRYKLRDLMPIHVHCHCAVAPIVGTRDPGRVIDKQGRDRLMELDPALGKRGANREFSRQLAKQADEVTKIVAHPELGPTLQGKGKSVFPQPAVVSITGANSVAKFAGWAESRGYAITSSNAREIRGIKDGVEKVWKRQENGSWAAK